MEGSEEEIRRRTMDILQRCQVAEKEISEMKRVKQMMQSNLKVGPSL